MSSRRRRASSRHPISRAALKRISLRTGRVGSQTKEVIDEIKPLAKAFIDNIVRDAVTYTEHARARTVNEKAVRHALERRTNLFSKKILGSPPSKRCESYEAHKRNRNRDNDGRKRVRIATGGVIRPKRKTSRGVGLARKIKFYQKQHDCLHLPKASTRRLVRSIGADFKYGLRWSAEALDLVQYSLELYLEHVFMVAGHLAIHRGGKGRVQSKDVKAAMTIEKLLEERDQVRPTPDPWQFVR